MGRDIARALASTGDVTLKVEDDGSKDGEPLVHLVLTIQGERADYWIDLEHGAIPRRILNSDPKGEPVIELRYDDIQPAGNGAWFPHRMTIFFKGGACKELVVDEADFTARPTAADLRLEFPEPVSLMNTATLMKYAPRKVWDVANLSGTGASAVPGVRISIQGPRAPAPPMAGELEARPAWALPTVVVGLVLTAAGALVYFGRRRYGAA